MNPVKARSDNVKVAATIRYMGPVDERSITIPNGDGTSTRYRVDPLTIGGDVGWMAEVLDADPDIVLSWEPLTPDEAATASGSAFSVRTWTAEAGND